MTRYFEDFKPGDVMESGGYTITRESILAFARKPSAERFVQEHGGRLLRFAEVAASHRP